MDRFERARRELRQFQLSESLAAKLFEIGGDPEIDGYYGYPQVQAAILHERAQLDTSVRIDEAA